MNKHTVEGTLRDVAGRVEGAVGALSNDAELELRGKTRQAAGKVQTVAGDAVDAVRDLASSKPIGTVLIAAGVAFLLGVFWAHRD